METCQEFENWFNEEFIFVEYYLGKEHRKLIKKLCWAAWEAGQERLSNLIKEMISTWNTQLDKQYGPAPTQEEREWMFTQLKEKRTKEQQQ